MQNRKIQMPASAAQSEKFGDRRAISGAQARQSFKKQMLRAPLREVCDIEVAPRSVGPAPDRRKPPEIPSSERRKPRPKHSFRTIFLSDIHLGTRGCKAAFLLDFLRHIEAEKIYLVGDIIDGWRLKKSWYWAPDHNDVVRKLLKRARQGTQIIYVPGNHDEALREYVGFDFAGVTIRRDDIHVTADGRRFWVLHGDEFDSIVRYAKWLAFLGDHAYAFLLELNRVVDWARRRLGYPYWSLSGFLKHKTKKAVEYMSNFEHAVAQQAAARHVDGVVCGHIHHAEIRSIGGILYCNDGDWVESCTALVEHHDGRLEILNWTEEMASRTREKQTRPVAAEVG